VAEPARSRDRGASNGIAIFKAVGASATWFLQSHHGSRDANLVFRA